MSTDRTMKKELSAWGVVVPGGHVVGKTPLGRSNGSFQYLMLSVCLHVYVRARVHRTTPPCPMKSQRRIWD